MPETEEWQISEDAQLSLLAGEIHIWMLKLHQSNFILHRLRKALSKTECQRAERFHFERDRRHFAIARGVLRNLLGRYLRRGSQELSFIYNEFGKPALGGQFADSGVNFNLSHSGEFALFAFTLEHEVGVDIELVREDFGGVEIAQRFFSPTEVKVLLGLPEEQRNAAFFRCWARKEAFIKAKGKGLSIPLDSFDVTLAPADPPSVIRTAWDAAEARTWLLRDVQADTRYAASFAVRTAEISVQQMLWTYNEN